MPSHVSEPNHAGRRLDRRSGTRSVYLLCNEGNKFQCITGRTRADRRESRIQAMLTALGFAPGPADDTLTPMTRDAILKYQRALGLDITGEPSEELAAHPRQLTGNRN
jgi:hypothetical protein